MSADEFKAMLAPKQRPAFGLLVGLSAGAAIVLLAASKVDAHIAGIVHSETDARFAAIDSRVQMVERERADTAIELNAHEQKIGSLDTQIQVIRAEMRRR